MRFFFFKKTFVWSCLVTKRQVNHRQLEQLTQSCCGNHLVAMFAQSATGNMATRLSQFCTQGNKRQLNTSEFQTKSEEVEMYFFLPYKRKTCFFFNYSNKVERIRLSDTGSRFWNPRFGRFRVTSFPFEKNTFFFKLQALIVRDLNTFTAKLTRRRGNS